MANQPESKPDSQGYRRRPLLVGLQICSSRCLGARSGKRRDDSKQLKWLYVLSSSTVALDVDVAAAEWKKQENMCINLKNLNLLGSCSLVRRLVPVSVPVPVPVLLWVHTSQTTPTATPATSCDLWAQLLYIFLSCCCRGSAVAVADAAADATLALALSLARGDAPSPARLFFVVVTLLFIQRHGPPIDRGCQLWAWL